MRTDVPAALKFLLWSHLIAHNGVKKKCAFRVGMLRFRLTDSS
jgi:hypothetical protein